MRFVLTALLLTVIATTGSAETLRIERTFTFLEHTTGKANRNESDRFFDTYAITPADLSIPDASYDRFELVLRPAGGTTLEVSDVGFPITLEINASFGDPTGSLADAPLSLTFSGSTGTVPAGGINDLFGFHDDDSALRILARASSDGPYTFESLTLTRDLTPEQRSGDFSFEFGELVFFYTTPPMDDPGRFTSITPEPASLALLAMGGLLVVRQRRA